MIIKLIVFAAIGYVLWRLFRPIKPPRPQPAMADALTMVRCAHCGLHLAEAEAVSGDKGLHFCSDAHRALGVSRP